VVALRALDFFRVKGVMETSWWLPLRNIYRADKMARHGFAYDSVGRDGK
jgi:UDPglucose 6-dehydrogenase